MEVLDYLESVGSETGQTKAPCVIADCGQLSWTRRYQQKKYHNYI